jgi:V8-like Glu-specific endopeptidase
MRRLSLLATAVFFALSAGGASAQSSTTTGNETAAAAASVRAYWTPERMASAIPLELKSNRPLSATRATLSGPTGPQVAGAGSPPTATGGPVNEFLYNATLSEEGGAAPMATSSTGAFFTTSRVFPDAATVVYPWRAAGKLFFSDPRTGGNFICSASVLRPRVIATAGHCVSKPSTVAANRYFFTNFLFVPAFRQLPPAASVAPYCSWTAAFVIVSNIWYLSNGSVPNAQDVALIEPRDKACTSRALQRLGTVTGWYGYQTNALIPQSITQIGYPGNLDQGLRMEVTWAESFDLGGNNTVRIGSAQRGGSSGGPWLKDFGVQPVDSAAHPAIGRNRIVSVTSYGPINESPQYLGGSILNNNFLSILNTLCNHRAGNC